MGGAVTILGAIRIPELAAAVCFYGLPPAHVANPADIRVPLQGHFANEDDWCTPEAVNAFEAVLKAANTGLDNGLDFERKSFYTLFASEDRKEGMQAFLEKRKPVFKGK